ncbi:MAG: hypothetical protein HGB15_05935 [Chlorobaculum sp.]|nr:hypothetical protein [Chlorobaculum sp.]
MSDPRCIISFNARHFGLTFENELLRVTIHSALHLMGHDESDELRAAMSRREDCYFERMMILKNKTNYEISSIPG